MEPQVSKVLEIQRLRTRGEDVIYRKLNKPIGTVERYEFKTFQALEDFFLRNMVKFKGSKTKVIGKTLLRWRNKK